ncbi:hypothetical protein GOBAR_AA16263 [Gossypium barbadense]|uniref:Uncharacterized protein n=1 Tax=Gossypium barbadense TaxID=3634 RepID=A0A2P5XM35_GOSBA|nr:hypothetical protein GOBAR_AA16263 [Gossypium barbadense]
MARRVEGVIRGQCATCVEWRVCEILCGAEELEGVTRCEEDEGVVLGVCVSRASARLCGGRVVEVVVASSVAWGLRRERLSEEAGRGGGACGGGCTSIVCGRVIVVAVLRLDVVGNIVGVRGGASRGRDGRECERVGSSWWASGALARRALELCSPRVSEWWRGGGKVIVRLRVRECGEEEEVLCERVCDARSEWGGESVVE